jgi:DNA-3-methyladenine glycosylase
LVTNIDGHRTSGLIVETEAYRAPDDKACHAYDNNLTPRTETMFEEGGVAYVYICYGIHHLFNVITAEKGMAHAILIRAVEPTAGFDVMEERRQMSSKRKEICNGPGKFAKAMGIHKSHNGISLMSRKSAIYIEDNGNIPESKIISGPRVGMSTAEECSNWPWRFRIKDNRWTSKPDVVWYDL